MEDDAVREQMREIANERCRFGYRRLAILLKREGSRAASTVMPWRSSRRRQR